MVTIHFMLDICVCDVSKLTKLLRVKKNLQLVQIEEDEKVYRENDSERLYLFLQIIIIIHISHTVNQVWAPSVIQMKYVLYVVVIAI